MRRVLVLPCAWLVIALLSLPAAAEPDSEPVLELSDFAYSQSLSPERGRALQTVLVPVEVYRGALRKNLADVRVFDPEGNETPHAIRTLARPTVPPRSSSALPIFPIYEAADETTASDLNPNGDLAIHIERGPDGELIDIRSAAPEGQGETDDGQEAGRIISYILDARAVKNPIVKLTVVIPETERDYVLPVQLEASDNLKQWRDVPVSSPLARLNFEGSRIEHDALEIAPTRTKYFRLSWPGYELPGPIREVAAEAQPKQERPARASVTLRGEAVDGEPGVYLFDAGGFVPADSVQLRLPEANVLVKGGLDSSDDVEGPWDQVTEDRFYRIVEGGEELQQPATSLARRAPRVWRLQITAGQKELGDGQPELTLRFYPDQVLFVSRGTDEHALAYGSYKAPAPEFTVNDLIELAPGEPGDSLPKASAALGPQESVGGMAALEEPPPAPPWRVYVLWALLVMSVLFLVAFAFRLLRQQ